MTVDGHEFRVRPRPAERGVYDSDWITGIHADHGFSSASSDRSSRAPAEIEDAIRGFLAQVDSATGYID